MTHGEIMFKYGVFVGYSMGKARRIMARRVSRVAARAQSERTGGAVPKADAQ